LNLRPSGPKPDALPGWATSRRRKARSVADPPAPRPS